MTRTPLSESKGQGQGHQAALLSAALTRKAAAAVSVGTYSARESTATLRWGAHWGKERGGGILCRHAHSLFYNNRCWSLVSVTSLLTLSVIATVKYSLTPLATWPPVRVESAIPALRTVSRGHAHFSGVRLWLRNCLFFKLNSRAFDHP